MARFGLDYAGVRAANPGVVYCSITGFGTGDGATLAGYDLLVQAVGGLMSITGAARRRAQQGRRRPRRRAHRAERARRASSSRCATATAPALGPARRGEPAAEPPLRRSRTRRRRRSRPAAAPRRMGNAHPTIAPYAVFRAADRELVIAVGNDKQFRALAGVLGASGLADDARFATNADRVAHRDELHEVIEAALAAASAAHWVDDLTRGGRARRARERRGRGRRVRRVPRARGRGRARRPSRRPHRHRSIANPIGLDAARPPIPHPAARARRARRRRLAPANLTRKDP